GVTVKLTSSSTFTMTISPGSVFIPAGGTTPPTQPKVTGHNMGLSTITASAPGYLTVSQQVPVMATVTLAPQPLVVPAGSIRLLSIALSSEAPSSVPVTGDRAKNGFVEGLTMQLSSSDSRVATLQPTVQFYSDGSSITTVVVQVTGVGPGTAVIHAGAPPFIPHSTVTVIVPSTTGAASIAATGGTPQTAQVNTPFGLPLRATVKDNG